MNLHIGGIALTALLSNQLASGFTTFHHYHQQQKQLSTPLCFVQQEQQRTQSSSIRQHGQGLSQSHGIATLFQQSSFHENENENLNGKKNNNKNNQESSSTSSPPLSNRRSMFTRTSKSILATLTMSQLAGVAASSSSTLPHPLFVQPASATVYFDPAMYGDQELRVSAVDSLRESVRRAILERPRLAPYFYILALLDALSFNASTGGGGPDGTIVSRILSPDASKSHPNMSETYLTSLREVCTVLIESKKSLQRLSAITLPDAIALSGAEAIESLGGPVMGVQLGRAEAGTTMAGDPRVSRKGAIEVPLDLLENNDGRYSPEDIRSVFLKSGLTEREMTALLGALLTLNKTEKDRDGEGIKSGMSYSKQQTYVERGKMGRMSDYKRISDEEMRNSMSEDFTGEEDDYDYEENEMGDKAVYIAETFGTRDQVFGKKAVGSSGKNGAGGGSSATTGTNDFNRFLKDLDSMAKSGKKGPNAAAAAEKYGWIAYVLLDKNNPTAQSWLAKYGGSSLSYKKDLGIAYNSITQLGAEFTGGKYENLLKNKPRKTLNDD